MQIGKDSVMFAVRDESIIPYFYIVHFMGIQSALHIKGESPQPLPVCIIQVDAAHWCWLRRDPPHDCKVLWVYNNTQ